MQLLRRQFMRSLFRYVIELIVSSYHIDSEPRWPRLCSSPKNHKRAGVREYKNRCDFSAELWYMFAIVVNAFTNHCKVFADCCLKCAKRTRIVSISLREGSFRSPQKKKKKQTYYNLLPYIMFINIHYNASNA